MGNVLKSPVNEPAFDVVHPVSRRPVVPRTSNADLPGLAGKKIALVWDYLFRCDDVFRLVKERFPTERSGVEFVDHEVFGDIHGPGVEPALRISTRYPSVTSSMKSGVVMSTAFASGVLAIACASSLSRSWW